jgi:hypothetical protein
MLSSEVTEGRRAFVAKNRQLVIEVVALASAPDEDFENRSARLVGARFFDHDEKGRSNTGWYEIVKLATSKEHNTIVAECRSLDAKSEPMTKKKLAYYGAESEEDFNGLLEMIKAYPSSVTEAAAQEAAKKPSKKRKAAAAANTVDALPPKRSSRRIATPPVSGS